MLGTLRTRSKTVTAANDFFGRLFASGLFTEGKLNGMGAHFLRTLLACEYVCHQVSMSAAPPPQSARTLRQLIVRFFWPAPHMVKGVMPSPQAVHADAARQSEYLTLCAGSPYGESPPLSAMAGWRGWPDRSFMFHVLLYCGIWAGVRHWLIYHGELPKATVQQRLTKLFLGMRVFAPLV